MTKGGGNGSNDNLIVNLCAFLTLFISGVIFLVTAIWRLADAQANIGWLELIKDFALLIGICVPAFTFAKNTGKPFWMIIYWIFFVIYVVCLIIKIV